MPVNAESMSCAVRLAGAATASAILLICSCGQEEQPVQELAARPAADPGDEAGPARPVPARSQGEKVYDAFCAGCHGPGGHGSPNLTEPWQRVELDGTEADLERTATMIREYEEGSSMAAYGGMLSEEEIGAVARYVLSLRRGEEAATGSAGGAPTGGESAPTP